MRPVDPIPGASPTGPVRSIGRRRRRRRGERGAVGGIEVLPFGVLVFVAGTLLLANTWAVIDAKLAVESAAREAGRAYVEAPDGRQAEADAAAAAADTIASLGRDRRRLRLRGNHPPFVRCAIVEHEASYVVPALTLPFLGGFGSGITVRGRHREVIDPFRSGLGAADRCAT
jgi:hypothetical protein